MADGTAGKALAFCALRERAAWPLASYASMRASVAGCLVLPPLRLYAALGLPRL
jgi:hypothetical protein